MAVKVEKIAIGIDLGTTNSCAAVWRNDRVEMIVNDQGNRTTPSYVAFTDSQRMIGDPAFNIAACKPTNTVFGKSFYTQLFLILFRINWYMIRKTIMFCLDGLVFDERTIYDILMHETYPMHSGGTINFIEHVQNFNRKFRCDIIEIREMKHNMSITC